MRLELKVAAAIAAATLLVGTYIGFAGTATAAVGTDPTQVVALDLLGHRMDAATRAGVDATDGAFVFAQGAYGEPITLQPTVLSMIERPGDKFTFQVYVQDSADPTTGVRPWVWLPFRDFEAVQLEDTNTVPPFTYSLGADDQVILSDGSSVTPAFPYTIRALYQPVGLDTTPSASYTETETVYLTRNSSTRVVFKTSGTVKHAGTRFTFTVSPNCGVGPLKVWVSKAGTKTVSYRLTTDENGTASATFKLGAKTGTYKVTALFSGNTYGGASRDVSKSVRATR